MSKLTAPAQIPTQWRAFFLLPASPGEAGLPGFDDHMGRLAPVVPMTSGKCNELPPKLKTAHLGPCRREPSDPLQGCFATVDMCFWKPVTASVILELFITVKYTVSLLLHVEECLF